MNRHDEIFGMSSPENRTPFTNGGYYPVNTMQLDETLKGALILVEEERFHSFVYIEGYLSSAHGGLAFFAIKDRTLGEVHLLSIPGMNE